ncbi:unnamed protein product [Cylindrotheca closterium]|uniref:Uncharacterized protein n=1 Tax=Cylindrotheca closterium TaxID=2856 RepID=A0AAD2G7G4_9STRA|nr:unnamed protein product [Cylindrotheca closterium]
MFGFGKKTKEEEQVFEHGIQKGDHLIRWTSILIWPVQVHAICIGACHDSLTLVDFGLTANKQPDNSIDKYKSENEIENETVPLEEMVDQQDKALIKAAEERRSQMRGAERITILTLTDEKEIRQWKKVEYGEEVSKKKNKWWFWKSKDNDKESKGDNEKDEIDDAKVEQEQDVEKDDLNVSNDTSTSPTTTVKPNGPASPKSDPAASPPVPKLPKSDPTNIVLARVRYLLMNPEVLPPHHILFSNSECIAVWVKTGRWSTLQASVFLQATTVGNIKNTATITATLAAATTTVTVPASGVMGWLGFTTTTQVGLMAVHPWLIPVLAGYGLIAIGTPMIILKKCKDQWKEATQDLTEGFWEWADSDIYVEAIHSWSGIT